MMLYNYSLLFIYRLIDINILRMYQRFNFLLTYCLKSFMLYIWIFNVFSEYMYIDFSHSHDVQKLFVYNNTILSAPFRMLLERSVSSYEQTLWNASQNDVMVSNCCFRIWNILVINNLKWHQLQNMYIRLWGP